VTDQVEAVTGKREQNKLRNRSVLLDAARAVFVELGYDAASVRDIVARTELAPGTFYNYFPDKRSVLIALMGEASAEASRRAHAARAQASSFEELAYRGFRAYFDFIASDRSTFELMRRNLSTLRTLGLNETGFAASLEDLRVDLAEAMARGALPSIPLQYLTLSIGAIAFEVGALMVMSDPPDVEGATKFAAEFCIGGIERFGRANTLSVQAPRATPARRKTTTGAKRRATTNRR
jgi:AcrR family transcriptional regulator